jgi:uncharacterized protein YegP (UPF0339 family)
MPAAQFEIFRGLHDFMYFRLRGADGNILLNSESYASKRAVVRGIESVQENAPDPTCYDVRQAANGSFYFAILAANGHVIAHGSDLYETEEACGEAMLAVQHAVSIATVTDLT